MSLRQPVQLLSLSPSGKLLATACGPKIKIVDLENNCILAASDEQTEHAAKCMVRHLVWHTDAKIVSNAEDKHVKEWRIELATSNSPAKLVLEQQRELPKRANAVSITEDGQTLVIADKFGDVYAFAMHGCSPDLPTPPTPAPIPEASTSTVGSKEDTPSESKSDRPGEAKAPSGKRRKVGNTGGIAPEWRHVPAKISALSPVVGHVSMLTAMLVLQKQGKIITADRDEHIRVSKWPQGWEIEHFLLGQRKFVSALALHPSDSNILLTAGGDDTLRMWDLTTYRCIRKDISAKPLIGTAEIKIELSVTAPGRRARKSVRKTKSDRKAATAGAQENGQTGQDENDQSDEGENDEVEANEPVRPANFVPKIRKLDLGITQMVALGAEKEQGICHIVVSSVGSSALLAWSAHALQDTSSQPPHLFFDFGSPVLSITANPRSHILWVSLDVSNAPERTAVQALHVSKEQLQPLEHSALTVLREECTAAVTQNDPYPGVQALFPDTALLSKEPSDRRAQALAEDGEDFEQELVEAAE